MKDFRNVIFILVIATFLLQMYVSKKDREQEQQNQKQSIAISNFSIYDIANHISQDTFDIITILPFGVDAHSFEPTPKLMAKILESNLVIYSGAGLEPWTSSFEFKSKAVDMSKFVKLNNIDASDHEEHEGHEHHKSEVSDPHYWLDIQNMIIATELICKEFIKLSPKDTEKFTKNKNNYIEMLQNIDAKYKKALKSCEKETIIVNHNAFSYLSKKYHFDIEALSGLSPDAQPSAKSMVRLIEHIKEHDVSTIFFESFVSDKAIKSIANEAKINVDVLQPLGNITKDEAQKKLTYQTIMLQNLEKISKALECK